MIAAQHKNDIIITRKDAKQKKKKKKKKKVTEMGGGNRKSGKPALTYIDILYSKKDTGLDLGSI